MSFLSRYVSQNSALWEERKAAVKRALPLSDAMIGRVAAGAGRFHQRFMEDYVFIHINKTGGTAIERALGIPLKNHDTALERRAFLGERLWARRFKFAVVRNPYTRIASQFAYVQRGVDFPAEEAPERFEAFLEKIYARYQVGRCDRNELDQLNWIADEQGQIIIDKICRYESLTDDMADVSARLGRPITLQKVNVTAMKLDYDRIYTARSRAIVNEMHRRDFPALRYQMVEA